MAHTTALSDSTDYGSVYSCDTDEEYDDRIESIYKESSEVSMAPIDNVFPISSYTSLRFCLGDGVGEDGIVASVPMYPKISYRYFGISAPMKRTGELEMRLEGSGGTDLSEFEIRLHQKKSTMSGPDVYSVLCCLTRELVENRLKRPQSVQNIRNIIVLSNRLGIKITKNGDLEYFIDGKRQGIVAEAVYNLGCNISYDPAIYIPPGLTLRITAGGKSLYNMP